MIIAGVGGILSNASAAVLKDGELASAVEQHKLLRSQRAGLPEAAIRESLRIAGVTPESVDCAALVRPLGSGPDTGLHLELRSLLPNAQVILVDHHTAHAASAFYASPFSEATVLTLDRAGDLRCGARWHADGQGLHAQRELYYPDSLAELYGRVTAHLGFQANADEHKVQWLSPSGTPKHTALFEEVLARDAEGWPRLERSAFDSNGRFGAGLRERLAKAERADIAASLQKVVEDTVLRMAGRGGNLALAGGLAFNALLVAALERSGHWENVFVQPAAGNSGTAFGAAFYAWHHHYRQTKRIGRFDLCLGPSYTAEEIKQVLENCKLRFRYLLTGGELIERAVAELNEQKIIAWMHGRMEFGPRALGNRSILAAPQNKYSTENLNTFIKHREPYRKFAASVPAELAAEYFETGPNSRFLATVGRVKPKYREAFEAAILGEDLIRVHSVRKEDNPLYWELLHAFGKSTGLPVLYNTSFNLFGDPLVCTPRDAVRSFYSSGIDSLFAGAFLLQK